ncbi:MAG: type II secretion system protein [Candidatus Omnitrophica bacterium]|nr:type II secretion system protein [Candidatus Omnitrophota bacterium]
MNKKGFTLIEVLFSTVIMSLVLVGVLFVFTQTVDLSRRVDFEYAATVIARSRIEWARSFVATSGFDALTDGQCGEVDTKLDASGTPDPNGAFVRSTSITQNYNGDARETKVTVSVDYIFRGVRKENTKTLDLIFVNI